MASEIAATVFTVKEVLPHPGADRLEIVQALGWQVVTGKGLRTAGEKCVYIQPDSLVPKEWAEKWGVEGYLKGPDKNRVGQIRLRGEPSFGFIVEVPEGDFKDGDNVAEVFGITKYHPPVSVTCGNAAPEHVGFPKYTDIENLRNLPNVFDEGEEVVATEKCHGTNSRVGMFNGEMLAGSMRLNRTKPERYEDYASNTYWMPWSLPNVEGMINALSETHKQVIVYGEIYGAQIQKGFTYDTKGDLGYKVFDIILDGNFLDHDDLFYTCDLYKVEMVPILYRGPYSLAVIKAAADGPSTLGEHMREGVVVRPVKERRDPKVGRLVMKYVGDEYLLSKHPDSTDM